MKRWQSRFCIFAALVLCLTAGLLLTFAVTAASDGLATTKTGSTLYVNDEPWHKDNVYKMEIIIGEYYVPISLFESFDGYEVTINRTKTEFMINDTRSERYISFNTGIDADNHLAQTYDKSGISLKTYRLYGGEIYVPVDLVADTMGLEWTVFTSVAKENVVAVRVCDGTQTQTFADLLRVYDPAMLTMPVTETTVTVPEETTVSEPQVDTEKRIIYLTFEDCPNEYTEKILDILDEYGYRAVFFLEGNALVDYTDTVIRMVAAGHSVGLHTMTGDEAKFEADIASFTAELAEENELLMRILKMKTHLVRAPGGSYTQRFYIDSADKQVIEDAGYVIWDWNFDSYDSGYYGKSYVASRVIEAIPTLVKSVIRFRTTAVTVQALPTILDFIAANENYTVKAVTDSEPEVNFAGYYG